VLVGADGHCALAALDLDRRDLLGEVPGRGGRGGPPVAFRRERVLVRPGHFVLAGDVLGRHTHMAAVEWVGQRAHHGINDHAVLHPLAPPHGGQPVLAAAHRLRAAGHGDVAVAELDRLRGGHDCLPPAAAQPVEGEGRGLNGKASVDRCHA
jgi:hypothetical protein